MTFLFYCLILILLVALHHYIYRREIMLAISGQDLRPYWHMLLPFSYVVVLGAVGSFSVLFAKSLLNEGLALFDAILIVPMFKIVWTFFSICGEVKDNASLVSVVSSSISTETDRLVISSEDAQNMDPRSPEQASNGDEN
uniref:Probable magnesium transporter n=1 Tax=Populus trichocarpa TaxID=3694 RepID=A0A2K2BMB7_POPTR